MRIVLIGAVDSTELTLNKLVAHGLDLVAVFGYESDRSGQVSGYVNLGHASTQAGVPYVPFKNINQHVEDIRQYRPDMLFVVGLSQLVSEDIIALASHGCVGFHPTALPEGRGRAPVPWMILEQRSGAASFFRIADGVDDGPLYVQKTFAVVETDEAATVVGKVASAMGEALDEWLPRLANGDLSVTPQNERGANYRGRRSMEDGWLNWASPAAWLARLVKATSHPYPGAYTFEGDTRVTVWRAEVSERDDITGVCGRILEIDSAGHFIVQCGTGLLEVVDYETAASDWVPRVGLRLGYYAEWEIHQLREQVADLSSRLSSLERSTDERDGSTGESVGPTGVSNSAPGSTK